MGVIKGSFTHIRVFVSQFFEKPNKTYEIPAIFAAPSKSS